MSVRDRRPVFAGEVVTYHTAGGDVAAILLQFNGVGNASLTYGEAGTEGEEWLENVREGPAVNQWDAIPPRR